MKRHYRIDRFNGMELLVCEVFTKHTWSQAENVAFFNWKEERFPNREASQDLSLRALFLADLDDVLNDESRKDFYGLTGPIPAFNFLPSLIIRGPVIDNRIMSLQVEYDGTILPPVVCEEIRRFYEVVESPHWRDMISHQVEQYGTLFGAQDD